ncbi:WhiB family transcriptional regulator [Pseudomonas corrugata]
MPCQPNSTCRRCPALNACSDAAIQANVLNGVWSVTRRRNAS